ncbi:MAG TPA: hypothetical protein DE179_07640 [Oceanospirillaceae bacterium]|nr:hypothetical protein [Oceanospirillaceae bacterium]
MTDKQDAKGAQTESVKSEPAGAQATTGATATTKSATSQQAKAANARAATKSTSTVPAQVTSKGAGLATLLAVAALLLGAYTAYQGWINAQQVQTYSQQQQQAQLSVQQSQEQQTAKVSRLVSAMQADISTEQDALLAQQARMDAALQQALQQMAQQQSEQQVQLPKWELAEAEYLLRLANQRLAMEQNPASALTLLQAADEIMHASEQLGSYGVRQAIAQDMAALTAVPLADIEGIFASLSALMVQAAKLTYVAPTMASAGTVPEPASLATAVADEVSNSEPMLQTWTQKALGSSQQALLNTWQELKVLVRVQQRTNADQLLLTPEVEALLRMRMQLALSQAQVALLRGQQTVYQASLAQVTLMLEDYYRSTDLVAQAMTEQVAELGQVQVMAAMPDISSSLYALQDLQAAIHAQQGAN